MLTPIQRIQNKIEHYWTLLNIYEHHANQTMEYLADKTPTFVYFIADWQAHKVKMGLTGDLDQRVRALAKANAGALDVAYYELWSTRKRAGVQELGYQNMFADYRDEFIPYYDNKLERGRKREWFRLEGSLLEFVNLAKEHGPRFEV
jgi:hypothetical protein